MNIINTVRGIIVSNGKLLAFPAHSNPGVWCLPGGKIEFGESMIGALEREILEETNIKPSIGKLLVIHEFSDADRHRIEFFFHIENGDDFLRMDSAHASHGSEVADHRFIDIQTGSETLIPDISETVKELIEKGADGVGMRILTHMRQ